MAKPPLPLSFRRRAEKLATAEREHLGLTPRCRLDPRDLADRHGIRVVALSDLPGVTDEQRAFLMRGKSKDLSALTVLQGERALVIVNDSHTPERQANSICHEIAHVLLGHAAGPIVDEDGIRVYPERQEDEANWLASSFLIPVKGLRMLYPKQTRSEIEANFGVSVELLRWRCNMHGLAKRKAA